MEKKMNKKVLIAGVVFTFMVIGLMDKMDDNVTSKPTPTPIPTFAPTVTAVPTPQQCVDQLKLFGDTLNDLMNATNLDHVYMVRDAYDKAYFDLGCNTNPYYDDIDLAVRVAIAESMFTDSADAESQQKMSAKSKLAIDEAWGVFMQYEKAGK